MSEQPADGPVEPQPQAAADPVAETPDELARSLVEDVRRLEESN